MHGKRLYTAVLVLLISAASVFGQTLVVHYGQQHLNLAMNNVDSLTFSESVLESPAMMEIVGRSDGFSLGGDLWGTEIAIRLIDEQSQPVVDGVPVSFRTTNENIQIGPGLTGNTSVFGEPQPGVVHTVIWYGPDQVNEEVEFFARYFIGGGGVEDGFTVALPSVSLDKTLIVDPANWDFRDHVSDYAVIQVRATVYDELGAPVPNQQVSFSAQPGEVYSISEYPPNSEPSPLATTDENGVAIRYIVLHHDDAFPDPVIPVMTCRASVQLVGVEGDEVIRQSVFLYQ